MQARLWLERCLELDSENHDARALLANLFYEGGEPERALDHLDRIPLENLWDPVSVWRLVELVRAYREMTEGARELDPYLRRLDQLFVEPTPEERILLEVEMEAAGLEAPAMAGRDQLDLFGGDPELSPAGQRMDWTGIVRAMCESSANPGQSVEEFMRETARRVRDMTGIEIPDDDPEAFLKASARAGVLHIDR